MSRKCFTVWRTDASRGTFDFQAQAIHYYKNDVDILERACILFQDQYLKDKKTNHYQDQYKNYSDASIQWLEWEAWDRKTNI